MNKVVMIMDVIEAKEPVYTLMVTEEELTVILRALEEYTEDNPNNTNAAERLHHKSELLKTCVQKDNELGAARAELLAYAGYDYYDND